MMISYLKNIKPFGLRLQNITMKALSFYGDRYIKIKIRRYGDKIFTNFCSLIVPESFTIISIDSLLVYENKYYLQVY